MIDAAAYATVAARFHAACTQAGLVLEKGRTEAGQLRYRDVAPAELLGRLLSLGYRITLQAPPDDAERTLRLIHPEIGEEEENPNMEKDTK